MSRIEVNLYWCKLRLVKYGLLKEAREVEDVGLKGKKNKLGADEGEGEDLSEDDDTNNIIEQRRYFVTRSLKHVESRKRKAEAPAVETEAGNEARKMILKDFHAAVVRSRKCANCKGYELALNTLHRMTNEGAESPHYTAKISTPVFSVSL